MTVIASCGHTLTDEEGLGWPIAVEAVSRIGEPAVEHLTVCSACLEWYKSEGLLLKNESYEKY